MEKLICLWMTIILLARKLNSNVLAISETSIYMTQNKSLAGKRFLQNILFEVPCSSNGQCVAQCGRNPSCVSVTVTPNTESAEYPITCRGHSTFMKDTCPFEDASGAKYYSTNQRGKKLIIAKHCFYIVVKRLCDVHESDATDLYQ